MKLIFEIKTEPVTQASIIVAVVAFSSGLLALIAIYSNGPLVSILCAVILVDAPVDEVLARVPLASCPALHGVPMVLQVSPLPETSDPEEFFYNPFANVKAGDFAAA
jgi:hypothetical protein